MWFDLKSIGGAEVDVHFRKEDIFVRGYYSAQLAEIIKASDHKQDLLHLLNYINCNVEFSHVVSTPRIYLSTDGAWDVVISATINNDVFSLAPVDCCQFITGYCPEFIEKFFIYIYMVIKGMAPAESCEKMIEERIINAG